MIIEDNDSDEEISDKKILEHSQDPKIQKQIEKILGKNPNTYFLN
jgi:hypothetical protein